MSGWTHVAAVFRVDGIRGLMCEPDWDEAFGKECLWESTDEVWEDCMANKEEYLPMGSEGSLQKSVWVNPAKNDLAAYTVSVFGDLRDYSSIDSIVEWFEKCCSKCWIRQAACTIENEWSGKTETVTYKENE